MKLQFSPNERPPYFAALVPCSMRRQRRDSLLALYNDTILHHFLESQHALEFSQSVSQSVSQPVSQSVSRSVRPSVRQSVRQYTVRTPPVVGQFISQSDCQPVSQSVCPSVSPSVRLAHTLS